MEKEMIYHPFFIILLILLSFMLLICLIRAVKGPRVADRLMAVNMMGTMVMVMISILALLLKEGYLVDLCLIYAMISFLAVVVISKVYIGIYEERQHDLKNQEGGRYGRYAGHQFLSDRFDDFFGPEFHDPENVFDNRIPLVCLSCFFPRTLKAGSRYKRKVIRILRNI